MTSSTATLFERQSHAYATARPGYPTSLYASLATLAPSSRLAWDCGCGSGQATVELAAHFEHVHGTDLSVEQITHATPHPHINYQVAPAEHMPLLQAGSVDLIAVATAIHWFDIEAFYEEVRRVLRPEGVLAIWAYSSHSINEAIDDWTARYARDVIGAYWRTDRLSLLHDRYATLPRPSSMAEITSELTSHGPWVASQMMTLAHYADYLRSWSASQAYRDACGEDPVSAHLATLEPLWGDARTPREVSWPLFMRVFRAFGKIE